MSRIYGRSSVIKVLSNDTKRNIINNKDKYNNLKPTISVFTDKELQQYVEQIHYKIKANENACLIARMACNDANKAVLMANRKIKTAIALNRVSKISKQINVFTTILLYNMNNLTVNLKISVQRNQINYLYLIIQFLLIKHTNNISNITHGSCVGVESHCSTNSLSPPVTPLLLLPNTYESKMQSFTNSSRDTHVTFFDDSPKKKCCFSYFFKKKGEKIYDISDKEKRKKDNYFKIFKKMLSKKIFCNEEYEDDLESINSDE